MNLKQLLLARSEWFADQIMKAVKDNPEFSYLTPAQSRLLAHMGGRPTSMASLARRLAISRQAVHKTVVELNRRGLLTVAEDPLRRNATLVEYTTKGLELNRAGAAIIRDLELRIAHQIGPDRLMLLKELLEQSWDDSSVRFSEPSP